MNWVGRIQANGKPRAGRIAGGLFLALSILMIMQGASEARRRHFREHVRERYSAPAASMAIDLFTGRILHAKNVNEPRYPASLTKVMTLYLLFDAIRDGKISMKTEMHVSAHAASQAPSKLDLEEGDKITVENAIGAIVTKSANDVAVVIAETLAGSEEEFARRMTQKARTIGMLNTTFRNASGLPNSEQRTTAQDLIILGKNVLTDHPERSRVFSTRYFEYHGETFRNHNSLLFSYQGMEGMKTGFTTAAGFNLIATARRGDKRVLAVVLGGQSSGSRNTAMRNILDGCWSKALTQFAAKKAGIQVADLKSKRREAQQEAPVETPVEKPVNTAPAPVRASPATVLAANFASPISPARSKPDRTSAALLLSALEANSNRTVSLYTRQTMEVAVSSGEQSAGGKKKAPAAEDMTTDEPEGKDEVVAATALAAPEPSGDVEQVAMIDAKSLPDTAPNMTVKYKTPRTTANQALVTNAVTRTESGPAPQPKQVVAAAVKEEEAEPQTIAAATAAESKSLDQPGPYHIQVGAFAEQTLAAQRIAIVKETLGSSALKAHPDFTMQIVTAGGATMFRARFARFSDESQAKSACSKLKRKEISCMVVKVQ